MSTTVNPTNAYMFADNFAIVRKETGIVYGCEHNKQEADAIASYLANYHGANVAVIKNNIDCVREARKLRNNAPYYVKNRDIVLRDMGVWQ